MKQRAGLPLSTSESIDIKIADVQRKMGMT